MPFAICGLLLLSLACRVDSKNRRDGSEDAIVEVEVEKDATTAVGTEASEDAAKSQPQGEFPAGHEQLTFSTYADVTAADVVEVVVLVDSALSSEQKETLAAAVDALLRHIINSNWKIAVADLKTTAYPTQFIAKYEHTTDYRARFAQALGVGTGGSYPAALPQENIDERTPLMREALRVFIIVTAKSFGDSNLANSSVLNSKSHRTKVYAILATEENEHEGYVQWKNSEDEHVLSRYGSLQGNYQKILADFSADIAYSLRGTFVVPLRHNASADIAIAQIKAFNALETDGAQEGFIHDSHYQIKGDEIFSNTKLNEGTCIDVTLSP